MDQKRSQQDNDHVAVIEAYLEALKKRDLSRCLDFYSEDAEIHFMDGIFKGRQAIEEWHKDRFEAELELLSVGKPRAEGDKVTFDATVTTSKLREWKIDKLAGRVTVTFEQGKIKETILAPRTYNPVEGW